MNYAVPPLELDQITGEGGQKFRIPNSEFLIQTEFARAL